MKHSYLQINCRKVNSGLVVALTVLVTGCGVTSTMEPYKQSDTVIAEGERVVILSRKHHATHEAEANITECIGNSLAAGGDGLEVHPTTDFEDMLYPWFEPSTAPLTTDELPEVLAQPGVSNRIAHSGVRYVVWLDGATDKVASGGGISCAAGVGGAGCLGLAWWQTDAKYEATIWDLQDATSAGTINADVTGKSIMPAIIIPLPFIARTKSHACRGLADQLKVFLTTAEG